MAVVEPANVPRFLGVCAKWVFPATVIGEVTGSGPLEMTWHGDTVVDIPPGTAADEGPVYSARSPGPAGRTSWPPPTRRAAAPVRGQRPARRSAFRARLARPGRQGLGHRAPHCYVRGDTVLAMPEDAPIRIDEKTGLGVALATDGNGRYALLDPTREHSSRCARRTATWP